MFGVGRSFVITLVRENLKTKLKIHRENVYSGYMFKENIIFQNIFSEIGGEYYNERCIGFDILQRHKWLAIFDVAHAPHGKTS